VDERFEALELRVRELQKRCEILTEENEELKKQFSRRQATAGTERGLDVETRA
jgi:chaperonin cofactor prefoldin